MEAFGPGFVIIAVVVGFWFLTSKTYRKNLGKLSEKSLHSVSAELTKAQLLSSIDFEAELAEAGTTFEEAEATFAKLSKF